MLIRWGSMAEITHQIRQAFLLILADITEGEHAWGRKEGVRPRVGGSTLGGDLADTGFVSAQEMYDQAIRDGYKPRPLIGRFAGHFCGTETIERYDGPHDRPAC